MLFVLQGDFQTVPSSQAVVHHYRDRSFCLDIHNTTAADYLKVIKI